MQTCERAIAVRGLTKHYGGRAVIDDLTFEVASGELFALLGPNGAGKTTAVEIMEGYRAPDAGEVRVLGMDPIRDGAQLKPRIGLMLQEGGVYPSIRPLEVLRLFAAFYPRPADPLELLRLVELQDASWTPYRQLSGGQKQRLSLALALVGNPELLFLDEPTAQMDPRARHATWDLVHELKARGVTILLTTHFMEEAEQLADRVAIVNRGQLRALDSPAELGRRDGAAGIRFGAPAGLALDSLATTLGARTAVEERPGRYVLDLDATPEHVAALTTWLAERDILLTDLRVGQQSLEDVFLSLTSPES